MPFCPEEERFYIEPKGKDKSGGQYWNFQETPFEEKRLRYILYLDRAFDRLVDYLEVPVTAYLASGDTTLEEDYLKVKDLLEYLYQNRPSDLFEKTSTEEDKATIFGTDEVYDLFLRMNEHASKMDFFSEFYGRMQEIFEKASKITTDIFTQDGTRGMLWGCLDTMVANFIDQMNDYSDTLLADNWQDRLTAASAVADDYYNAWDSFKDSALQEAQEIRAYIDPIVQFLNACKIITICAATPMAIRNLRWYPEEENTFHPIIVNALRYYGSTSYGYQEDKFISANGSAIQISDNLFNHTSRDGSDADLFESNATKIAMDDLQVGDMLEEAFNNMIEV